MKRVRLITEDEIGGFLGAADSEFERPLNNAIRKIEKSGGIITIIKYNTHLKTGSITSIAIEYEIKNRKGFKK